MSRLVSSAQIIQDLTADFKVYIEIKKYHKINHNKARYQKGIKIIRDKKHRGYSIHVYM